MNLLARNRYTLLSLYYLLGSGIWTFMYETTMYLLSENGLLLPTPDWNMSIRDLLALAVSNSFFRVIKLLTLVVWWKVEAYVLLSCIGWNPFFDLLWALRRCMVLAIVANVLVSSQGIKSVIFCFWCGSKGDELPWRPQTVQMTLMS